MWRAERRWTAVSFECARGQGRLNARRGQAAIELLAVVTLLVALGLLAWQLTAVLAAAQEATARAREAALTQSAAGVVTVDREVRVPQLLPGVRGLRARARLVVRGD